MRRHLYRCCPAVLLVVLTAGCTSWSGARWGGLWPKPTFAAPDRGQLSRSPEDPPAQDEERGPVASATRDRSRPKIAPSEREGMTQSRPPRPARSPSEPPTGPTASAPSAAIAEAGDKSSSGIEAPDLARPAPSTAREIRLASAEREQPPAFGPDAETKSAGNTDTRSWKGDVAEEPPFRQSGPIETDPRETSNRMELPGGEARDDSPFARRPMDAVGSVDAEAATPLSTALPATDRRIIPVAAEEAPTDQRDEVRHASAAHRLPGLDPMFPPRLSDWDPTKLIGRRKPVDPVRTSEIVEPSSGGTAESGVHTPPPYEGRLPAESAGLVRASATGRTGSAVSAVGLVPEAERISIDPNSSYVTDELRRVITLYEAEALAQVPDGTPDQQRDYVRRHIHLRLLQLVAGQASEAQKPIPGIDPVDQEFWNSVLWGLDTYFDRARIPDPAERTALTAAQFQAAARHLQATARMELKNVAFCHRIDGFGTFERFPRDEFEAGVPVLIYSEVRNFGSEPVADGHFRTVLKSTVEIVRLSQQNAVIERLSFEPTEDLSRSPRTDFYNSYKIQLPATLTPGPYLLRLMVEDEMTGKTASQTLQFSIR